MRIHNGRVIFEEVINDLKNGFMKRSNQLPEPKQNVIVEFSSPNIAKPFHVGNFRSTIVGNYIANLMYFYGHNVIRLNYLGDWGTQFGILSLGYDYFGDDEKLKSDALRHLLEVYVESNKECKTNEEWVNQAKQRFYLLETKQNLDAINQWKQFRDLSVKKLIELYNRLGINFDEFHSESMYSQSSLKIVDEMKRFGFIEQETDGATFALIKNRQTKSGREKVPLIKNDGSSLYITRDIAAALHRKERFDFDKMYYVVDNGQSDHFVNLKNILKEMNVDWYNDLIHVKFGRIQGMSTRKGEVVFLEDLLDEAKERALKSMMETETTKVSQEEFVDVADILGTSGVIINDFKYRRTQNYKFDWNHALQQHGDTGIGLQYAFARLCNLERNCQVELDLDYKINYNAIDTSEGNDLVSTLASFNDALTDSYNNLDPNFLVKYLFTLRNSINKANKYLTVKGEEESIAKTRLLLFHCSKRILFQCMKLLGLKPLEKM